MVKTVAAVVDAVNAAGGILGSRITLLSEDTETNPDAAVRAARKLIDVDKVPCLIGTWASAVTTAVAPLAWESKTMLFTVSGADSITKLPHLGYIIRTQPNTELQSARAAEWMAKSGAKRVFALSAQTPFAVDSYNRLTEILKQNGSETVGDVIYDAAKTSFRSEIDQALRAKPDMLFLNGYTPDVTIIMRELYQAGYDGQKFTFGYAGNAKMLASLPPAVSEGLITFSPSPDIDSPAYAEVKRILATEDPDPYSCQTYDHASMAILAIAKAGRATGDAIHDTVRRICQGDGMKVTSALDGLKALAAGHEINYDGASGPCDFRDSGDILGCKFRFEQVRAGKLTLLSIS
jgi:branched-chain amino acid transport system substrate-binding protein